MLAAGVEEVKKWRQVGTAMMRMAVKDPVTGFTQQVNTLSIDTYRAQKFMNVAIRWTELRLALLELLSKSY